jgi:hypothetical protein
MEKIPYLGQNLTRWRVGQSTFLALPEKGARLMNWNITLGDGSVRDVIYWPELTSLEDFHKVRGGNPILFPFNGRCFDRGEIFFWRAADGVKRAIPIHGIGRQGEFKTLHVDERGFTAQFMPGEEARAAYPFEYELRRHLPLRAARADLRVHLEKPRKGASAVERRPSFLFHPAVERRHEPQRLQDPHPRHQAAPAGRRRDVGARADAEPGGISREPCADRHLSHGAAQQRGGIRRRGEPAM